jgi:hypothetical protein
MSTTHMQENPRQSSVAELDAEQPAVGLLTDRQLDEEVRDLSAPLGLRPGEPDFTLHIHAAGGRYYANCFDAGPRLKWRVCAQTMGVPENAHLLYAAQQSLASINDGTIGTRLCVRFGYLNRRAARQSLRKVKVHISVTDQSLAELSQTLADAEDPKALLAFMDEPDARRYAELVTQLRRFDTVWFTIEPTHGLIDEVRRWAQPLLKEVRHDGELRSRKLKVVNFPAPSPAADTAKHTTASTAA